MMTEGMTPNEVGITLLILFGFTCIAGYLTEKFEQKFGTHKKNNDEEDDDEEVDF